MCQGWNVSCFRVLTSTITIASPDKSNSRGSSEKNKTKQKPKPPMCWETSIAKTVYISWVVLGDGFTGDKASK
jgi:hypothetical protein